VAALPDGAFKSYASAELDIVRAQMNGAGDATVTGLQRAITFFEHTEPARVPGLYLLLARTPQARASRVLADNALQSGISTLERQQAGVSDDALRISYFDDSWSLFQDMVMLQVAANDSSRAFEFAERSRARSLLATAQGSAISRVRSLDNIKTSLPDSVVLVQYATLHDRVLIWTITRGAAVFTERRIGERELERLVKQHRAAIQDQRDNTTTNDRLHEILVAPVATAAATAQLVVLIPDGFLQQLPFATLRDPATRRFLIEDHALILAPSASFFIDTHAAKPDVGRPTFASALLVGNPSATGLRPLPGAEAEVAATAALYERSRVLTGREATRERFLELAPLYDVVHFGGHALVNPEFPLLSRLVFADQGGREQALFAHEISRVRFPRTRLVFLAACSTASGAVSRGEGVLGVARPFLAGGVPVVIASQWDVDDHATEQLTIGFHRELKKLRDPVRALRASQLAMLRSGDRVLALPRSWGAFVTVGTTTRESSGQ
jgi:CHAT domain-containing protein